MRWGKLTLSLFYFVMDAGFFQPQMDTDFFRIFGVVVLNSAVHVIKVRLEVRVVVNGFATLAMRSFF